MFETMFGTDDKVDSAMTAEEIAAPFVQAFEVRLFCKTTSNHHYTRRALNCGHDTHS